MTTGLVVAVARRAMVVAFAALVVAIVALAIAIWALSDSGTPGSDVAESDASGGDVTEADTSGSETSGSDSTGSDASQGDASDGLAPADEPASDDPPSTTVAGPAAEEPTEDASTEDTDDASAPATTVPDAAADAPETTVPDASSTTVPAETVPLPGEPYEFGPSAGAGLAVVGVAHDSALNVRDIPNGQIIARLQNVMDGARDPVVQVRDAGSNDIIATLDLLRGVVATGNTRKLPTTIWHEIRVGDVVGWSSGAYLAPLGSSHDATSDVVAALGEALESESLGDLGLIVAGLFTAEDEVQSRVEFSGVPGVFEALGEVTVDVLGLPDDSVQGYRIGIGADAAQEDGYGTGPFTLRWVSVRTICDTHRGVSADGRCN